MKITINNKTLSNALSRVTSVIEKRNTIEILSNIYVSPNNDGTITLQGTDLDITLSTTVSDAVVEDAKPFTASASMLSDIVKRLPDGDVKLEYDGETLHVKAGRSKFKMQTLPSRDFPAPKSDSYEHGFSCAASDMKMWLDRVSFCVSNEEARYYLNGVYLDVSSECAKLVATDGHRLARQIMDIGTPDGANSVIIPRKTIAEITKLCYGDTVHVNWNDRSITFKNENTTLTSKLIDATYPEYERVIPRHNDNKLTIDANTIKAASDRVASINDEKTRAVKIECRNGEVDLSVQARNDNSANETIDADCGFDLVIGVNSRYFADAMNRINGDASLEFADSNTPMLIREVGDDRYLSLIMPVRVG